MKLKNIFLWLLNFVLVYNFILQEHSFTFLFISLWKKPFSFSFSSRAQKVNNFRYCSQNNILLYIVLLLLKRVVELAINLLTFITVRVPMLAVNGDGLVYSVVACSCVKCQTSAAIVCVFITGECWCLM